MSYQTKYIFDYLHNNNTTISVHLQKRGFLGTHIFGTLNTVPSINYKSEEDVQVIGSMLEFGFLTRDKTAYQDLLEADNKDFRVLFYIAGVLKWTGFLIPDQITTEYFSDVYFINIESSDGLGSLNDFELTNLDGTNITNDKILLIELVRNCLAKTELGFSQIAVNINTRESEYIALSIFRNISIRGSRLLKDNKNKVEYLDCKQTINECLKLFNAKVFQADGRFYIVNELEVNSEISFWNFSDFTNTGIVPNTVLNNNVVNITNFNFLSNSQTLIKPVSEVEIKYTVKVEPTNLFPTGFFDQASDLNNWNVTSPNVSATAINLGELRYSSNGKENLLFTNTIAVTQLASSDEILIRFDASLQSVTFVPPPIPPLFPVPPTNPTLIISVLRPNGTVDEIGNIRLENLKTRYEFKTPNIGTGNYSIRFFDTIFNPESNYSNITYRLDNVSLSNLSNTVETDFETLNSRRNPNVTQTKINSYECIFGDGSQSTNLSALYINGNIFSRIWRTFGRSENLSLINLFVLNKLRMNHKIRNKLELSFLSNEDITFLDHIIFDSKRYFIRNYKCIYGSQYFNYILTLEELIDINII